MTPPPTLSDASFPPVGGNLVAGTAAHAEVDRFLTAVRDWRPLAAGWLREAARGGVISIGLRDLVTSALGLASGEPTVSTAYLVGRFPPLRSPATAHALDVLVWRSGIVDYLADAWDTIGSGAFEMRECALVIDEVLTPRSARRPTCPDCLQPLPEDTREAGRHALDCPIRLRRERAAARSSPPM